MVDDIKSDNDDKALNDLFPQLAKLSKVEKQIKVARHLHCDQCECIGWRSRSAPASPSTEDKGNGATATKACFKCQHDLQHHLDKQQDFIRRLKVALRIDDLLEEKGIVLNGDSDNDKRYLNDKDIASLKKQMDYNAQQAEKDAETIKNVEQDKDTMHTSTEDDFLSEASSPSSIDAEVVADDEQSQHTNNMKRLRVNSDNEDDEDADENKTDNNQGSNKRFKVDTEDVDADKRKNGSASTPKKRPAANKGQKAAEEDEIIVDDAEEATFADHEDADDDEAENNDKLKEDQRNKTSRASSDNEPTDINNASSTDVKRMTTEEKSQDDTENEQKDVDDEQSGDDMSNLDQVELKDIKSEPQLGDKRCLNEEAIKVNGSVNGSLNPHKTHNWDFLFDLSPDERKETPAMIEERTGLIEVRVVENDGTRDNMILLTGLKNIFQKQLPKMPKEYIARLVYDRNHKSMALIRRPLKVIGGICYRPFEPQEFAEIVFCAIASTEQVKGYGSFLMSHLKDYVSEHTRIKHYLTYADNYATGYFRKQGFTTEITLDKRKWVGYIKDYEGGTIMQCTTVPKVRYLQIQDILTIQKKAVYERMKQFSNSHIVYPGIQMPMNEEGKRCIDPYLVPGVKESGWTPEMDALSNRTKHPPHYNQMRHLVSELRANPHSWPFHEPVNADEVTDYYQVITEPMDLSTLEQNVETDQYETLEDFIRDVQKIFDNCRKYNADSTNYARCANRLEKYFKERLCVWTDNHD